MNLKDILAAKVAQQRAAPISKIEVFNNKEQLEDPLKSKILIAGLSVINSIDLIKEKDVKDFRAEVTGSTENIRARMLAKLNARSTPNQKDLENAKKVPVTDANKLKEFLKKPTDLQAVDLRTEIQKKLDNITLNEEQQRAVDLAADPKITEMCLIGAAGTGKTTVVKRISANLLETTLKNAKLSMHHRHLPHGIPAIAFVSFTNRAVRNLRRVLPKELQANCVTIHALLEYYFERVEKIDAVTGMIKMSQMSVPKRNADYQLTSLKFLVVDEASMCSVPLWEEVRAALPEDCQILFLGDLNQLPPIYSSAILGYKLAQSAEDPIKYPCVELTQVYRQALDNPILFDAHRLLANDIEYFHSKTILAGKLNRPPFLIYKPFKKQIEAETACIIIGKGFAAMMDTKEYDPENDCILIPYNKQFGTLELNKFIAQKRQELANVVVYEVISLYLKHYFAVGDRILLGKYEGKITEIIKNPKYVGKSPREADILLTRWGHKRQASESETIFQLESDNGKNFEEGDLQNMSMDEIDAMLNKIGKGDDAKRQASHILTIELAETGEVINISEAGEINSILFAYALTVHKAQGAEWRKVFFILHSSHGTMASRELIYTAMTRAREELVMIVDAKLFHDAVGRQKIKGNNLKEKAIWFQGKKEERQRKAGLQLGLTLEGE